MTSFTASPQSTGEFAIVSPYLSKLSDDKLLEEYSDLMYTSRGNSASSDERHALLAEIQRRKLNTSRIETPLAAEDRLYRKNLEANYSANIPVIPRMPTRPVSHVPANRENVKALLARIFTGKK